MVAPVEEGVEPRLLLQLVGDLVAASSRTAILFIIVCPAGAGCAWVASICVGMARSAHLT
jgi:hypothetical protein